MQGPCWQVGSQLIGSCRASALVLHLPPCEGFLTDFTHHDAFSKCSKTVVRPSKSKVGCIRATKTNLQRFATSFQLSLQQHGTSMSHRRQSNHFCRNNRNTLGIWTPASTVKREPYICHARPARRPFCNLAHGDGTRCSMAGCTWTYQQHELAVNVYVSILHWSFRVPSHDEYMRSCSHKIQCSDNSHASRKNLERWNAQLPSR